MEYAEIVEDNGEDIRNLVLRAYDEYSTCVIKTLNKIFNKMDQNSYLSLSMLTTLCRLAGFKLEKVSPRVGVEAAKEKVIKNANINTNIYQFLQLFFTNLLSIKNSKHLATVIEKYYGLYHYLPNQTFISLCRSVMSISSMMGFEKKKSALEKLVSCFYWIEEKVIKVIKEEFDCRFKSVITSDVQVKQRPSGNNKKRKQLTKDSSAENKNKKQKNAKVAKPIPTSALVPEQPIHPRPSQPLLPAPPITPSPKPSKKKKKKTHQEVHLQGYLRNIRGRERCK